MASTTSKKPRAKKYSKSAPKSTWSKSPKSRNGNGHHASAWKPYNTPSWLGGNPANMPPYLADTVNRMVEELTTRWDNTDSRPWTPRCDWWETSSGYTMCCYVPGCSKTDCKIECTENSCTISGSCPPPSMPKNATCYSCECQYGNWRRTFNFPYPIQKSSVKAACKNGVLTITCKKLGSTKQTVRVA
jgi:HSP20 family protein